MTDPILEYPCTGVCIFDPESDRCLGCDRPSWPTPSTIQEPVAADAGLAITDQVTPAR